MDLWRFTFLGYKARVLHPEALVAAAVVAALGALAFWAWRRRVRRVRSVVPGRLMARMLPGYSPLLQGTRLGLSLLGMVVLTAALMQPQCGTGSELVRRTGIDVVVALDVSNSMMARDIRPSRLTRARLELGELLDALDGDRFGLVVFAGSAFVQSPLTTDYAAARLFLRAVDPQAMPRQGTDVGAALRSAAGLLSTRQAARSQVVVLMTDGEDHGPGALQAARELAESGIRVFAVGIGSPGGEPIPVLSDTGAVLGYKKDRLGETVLSRLDEGTLREIAQLTGGRYVRATDGGVGVSEVVRALDDLEASEFEARITTRYEDRSILLLAPGFLLLAAGTLLPARRRAPGGRRAEARKGAAAEARKAAVLLLLLGPALGGWRPFESVQPDVARGNEAYAEGDHAEALRAYDAALEKTRKEADRARVHYDRGTAMAASGDVEGAQAAFDAVLADGDADLQARGLYNLGTALLARGDPAGAVRALTESLKRDPTRQDAKYNLELALQQQKQQQEQEQQQQQQGQDGSQDQEQDQGEEPSPGDDAQEADGEGGEGPEDEAPPPEEGQAPTPAQDEDGATEPPPQPGQAETSPDEQAGEARPQAGRAQPPRDVGEQEAERILEALRRAEKPLQMHLFAPGEDEPESGRPQEKDW